MNFNFKPNILSGHSIKDFFNYNLYFFIAVFLLVGMQKLVIYPFIAKQIGSEQFGSFILFITLINILIVAIPGSINQVIIRVHSDYKKKTKSGLIKTGLIINIIISVLVGLVLVAIFPLFAKIFNINPVYKIFLVPLAFYLIIYNIRESFLIQKRINLKFKEIALYNIFFALLFLLVIPLYHLLNKQGIPLGYILVAIISTLILIPRTKSVIKGDLKKKYLLPFYKFVPSFALVSIIELLLIASSRYIISFYESPTQVAYFFAATSVVKILIFPFRQIRTILLPFISQKKKMEDFSKKEIKFVLVTSLIIGILLFLVGIILGRIIITFLYGVEYYRNARIALLILLIGYAFNVFKIYLKNFIIVFFSRKILVFNVTIMLFLNILINIIFVPKYGIKASAVGLSLSLIVSTIIWYISFVRKLKKSRG